MKEIFTQQNPKKIKIIYTILRKNLKKASNELLRVKTILFFAPKMAIMT
jgi:hypothetical protein